MSKLITLGNDLLTTKSLPAETFDDKLVKLINKMYKIMIKSKGIGLAAVQIGEAIRLFIVQVPDDKPRVFINPEIVERSGKADADEGCLSVPDVRGEVGRAAKVTVEALNLDGKKIRIEATDLLARIFQHEIDHLNGVLFIDHLSRLKKQLIKKHLKKIEQETKEG